MIAFVILTIGFLGAIGLQAKAKQASYDSLQRAAALTLANDVIHRLRANDTSDLLSAYNIEIASTDQANQASIRNIPSPIKVTDLESVNDDPFGSVLDDKDGDGIIDIVEPDPLGLKTIRSYIYRYEEY